MRVVDKLADKFVDRVVGTTAATTKTDPVSEMAIVDTFTKLIFGEEDGYTVRELSIIQAFRAVDANVLRESHGEMGEYLRNLGVREMIQLVSRLREHLLDGVDALCAAGGCKQEGAASAQHRSPH